MVRANPPADAIDPAPESLQGLLRLAAQLESLADSPELNRRAAARAVLPPAPDANYSLVESAPPPKLATATALKQPSSLTSDVLPLATLLPFALLVVLLLVTARLVVCAVESRRRRRMRRTSRSGLAASKASDTTAPVELGRRSAVPADGPDRELVLELVLSQDGPSAPRQQLLQRIRQLSRGWARRIPSLRPALAPAAAERAAAARVPTPPPMVPLPPCATGRGRGALVVQLGW